MKKIVLLLLFCSVLPVYGVKNELKKTKYVFLFIGDGMGEVHRQAAEEYAIKTTGKGLVMNSLPRRAQMTTFAANNRVTDSAASGTALATGSKTNVWHIGVDPEGNPLESSAYVAKKSGKKVGIISSKFLNDATPAAFYAHTGKRSNLYSIALELIDSGFDFYGGGGILSHNNRKEQSYKGDIYDLARDKGYFTLFKADEINALKPGAGKVIATLFPNGGMPYARVNKTKFKLADYLAKAIELFEGNEKGFLIMCEGGMIDWAGHANDARSLLTEIADMDQAVKVAYDFYTKHKDETLIVVTADHETGGLSYGKKSSGYDVNYDIIFSPKSPERGKFAGKFIKLKKAGTPYSFEDLKRDLFAYGFDFSGKGNLGLTPKEIEELEKVFNKYFVNGKNNGDYYMLDTLLLRLYNLKAGFKWNTNGHSGSKVITTSCGINSEYFAGELDNTDIGKIIKAIVK